MLITEITALAEKEGWSPVEINFFEGDCWQHLRNIWFGAMVKQLNKMLTVLLEDDLNKIPSLFCMFAEIDDLLHCIEKEFGLTANYTKGHGSIFENQMKTYHPTAYLFPIIRACGGSRQDLGVEGVQAVLMNLPYYLQFLH